MSLKAITPILARIVLSRRGWTTVAVLTALVGLLTLMGAAPATQLNDDEGTRLRANLKGFAEVPSKSTTGRGTFHGTISPDGNSISFELMYSGLVADALFSHIHFAQKSVNGGIVVYLCNNAANPSPPIPPSRTPKPCPLRAGTVTGTLTAADVTNGAAAQGISTPADFLKLLEAIRGGVAYVNVHSTTFPPGEIRGQIQVTEEDADH